MQYLSVGGNGGRQTAALRDYEALTTGSRALLYTSSRRVSLEENLYRCGCWILVVGKVVILVNGNRHRNQLSSMWGLIRQKSRLIKQENDSYKCDQVEAGEAGVAEEVEEATKEGDHRGHSMPNSSRKMPLPILLETYPSYVTLDLGLARAGVLAAASTSFQ